MVTEHVDLDRPGHLGGITHRHLVREHVVPFLAQAQ